MVDQTLNIAGELGDDKLPDLSISIARGQWETMDFARGNSPFNEELANQELGISALCKGLVLALQFFRNHLALFHVRVLQCTLDDANGIVLEHKVPDSARDDLEQLLDQLVPLILRDMGFPSQALPYLL